MPGPSPTIGVVIPAYNEGPRIGNVVRAARAAARPSRVVVIDDGSKDDTVGEAQRAGAEVFRMRRNSGKALAMHAGVGALEGLDAVCFLDGDLVGLRPDHVDALCRALHGDAKMVLGMITEGAAGISQPILPVLSGQRVLHLESWRLAVQATPSMLGSRFGVEAALTVVANRFLWPVRFVRLEGLGHTKKEAKAKRPLRGFVARMKMYANVLSGAERASGGQLQADLLGHLGHRGHMIHADGPRNREAVLRRSAVDLVRRVARAQGGMK